MIKPSISTQDLRRRIYIKAKSDKSWRFWGLYVHICKMETLREAYRLAKENNGAPGIDGVSFDQIEENGREEFLRQIRAELIYRRYRPMRNRRREIPKEGGKVRVLGIPSIRDRVVQGALKLILEPIFEADFCDCSYGYRPNGSPHQAVKNAVLGLCKQHTKVIDVDLAGYFDNIRHHILLSKVARRVRDNDVMRLLKMILKVNGKRGVPQGGVISPLLANIYLTELDEAMEKMMKITRYGKLERLTFVRFADDMVVLVDGHPRQRGLLVRLQQRLMEELEKLEAEMNEEKTKVVDVSEGGSFEFLGFVFRLVYRTGKKPAVIITPKMKKRTELLRKIKRVLASNRHRTVEDVVKMINPIIRGWVNYFRVGNSARTFGYVKNHIEKKVRRFAMRARLRKGFGWKRWSRETIYGRWGLYNDYQIRYW